MLIRSECSECFQPLDVNADQKTITCPSCGLVHDIVYLPRLQPRRNQPVNKPYNQTRTGRRSAELAKVLSLG
ncbi:hypothetical protein [Methanosarcina sp. UBA289]|uniref:hypothetical protein n=1 Tax=Methanosarcina sp. UBA289 TaxID=1915574 RepID=UPI0025D79F60|nr:hypothetical protein [Methanosarcina sp. UBA289]